MHRPQLIRRLRIAASLFFAVVTVAICMLWVRSYWWQDCFRCTNFGGRYVELKSFLGHITVVITANPSAVTPGRTYTQYRKVPTEDFVADAFSSKLGFRIPYPIHFSLVHSDLYAPHWVYALAFSIVALASSARRRTSFSLRTLLIAITLVAVALGLGVWAAM